MVQPDSMSSAPPGGDPGAAVLLVGPGQRVQQANQAAAELFGLPMDSLRGLSMEQLVPTERRGELQNLHQVLSGGSPRRLRTIVRSADGRRIDVTASFEPVSDGAGNIAAVSIHYQLVRNSARWQRSSMRPPSSDHSLPPISGARTVSERRLTQSGFVTASQERLAELDQQLAWLEQTFANASGMDLSQPQARARIMLHIAEARALAHACRVDLAREAQASAEVVPAPPKLPKL